MKRKVRHNQIHSDHTELPPELKALILTQPLYRQTDVKRFIPASDSVFEQGRLGIGALSGLRFSRMGRMVVYQAGDLIEYLEQLPSFQHVSGADQHAA